MQPLLTIGIPTYNRKDYLRDCIESCFAQENVSPGNIQIVVSDNASEDGTQELLEELVNKVPQGLAISTVYHKSKVPAIENWNACLERAEGEFFLLLSDDDLLQANFVHTLEEALQAISDEVAGCMFGFQEIDTDGKCIKTYENKDELVDGESFFYRLATRKQRYHWSSFVSRSSALRRSQVFQTPFPGSGMFADGAGLAACCGSGAILKIGGKPQVSYRVHSGNDCRRPDIDINVAGRDLLISFVDGMPGSSSLFSSLVRYWCADGYFYQIMRWVLARSLPEREELGNIIGHMEMLGQGE